MLCKICREREAQHAFWGEQGVCDYCAEEYGCECKCFPPPSLRLLAENNDLEPERVDTWRFVTVQLKEPQHAIVKYDEYGEPYAEIVPEQTTMHTYIEEGERWQVRD